jgi:hypothetical protein
VPGRAGRSFKVMGGRFRRRQRPVPQDTAREVGRPAPPNKICALGKERHLHDTPGTVGRLTSARGAVSGFPLGSTKASCTRHQYDSKAAARVWYANRGRWGVPVARSGISWLAAGRWESGRLIRRADIPLCKPTMPQTTTDRHPAWIWGKRRRGCSGDRIEEGLMRLGLGPRGHSVLCSGPLSCEVSSVRRRRFQRRMANPG